jgi:predicted Zn-dependent protease
MYGYLQLDRPTDARRILDGCRAQATGVNGLVLRSPEEDPLDPDNIPAGSYIQMWSRYMIDTTDGWQSDLLNEDLPLGALTGAKLTRAYVRGLAASARHDAVRLDAALKEVESLRRQLPDRSFGVRYADRGAVLEGQLRALQLLEARRPGDAVAALRDTASRDEAMPIEFGPPFVDKPTQELLGDVLLTLNRPDEAAAAYRAALKRTPNRTSAVRGLATATRLQKPG